MVWARGVYAEAEDNEGRVAGGWRRCPGRWTRGASHSEGNEREWMLPGPSKRRTRSPALSFFLLSTHPSTISPPPPFSSPRTHPSTTAPRRPPACPPLSRLLPRSPRRPPARLRRSRSPHSPLLTLGEELDCSIKGGANQAPPLLPLPRGHWIVGVALLL
jgi:hypothetical protein